MITCRSFKITVIISKSINIGFNIFRKKKFEKVLVILEIINYLQDL